MSTDVDMHLLNLERKATEAVTIAASRGIPVPKEYLAATRISQEANKLANQPLPNPRTLPAKAADVEQWVADVAQQRLVWREGANVAADLAAEFKRAALRVAIDAVPTFLTKVIEQFNNAAAEFHQLRQTAPPGVSSNMTGAQFEMHADLLRAAENMTSAAIDRSRLALLTDEADEIRNAGLWLVIDPPEHAMIGQVTELVAEYGASIPTTLDQWLNIAEFGIGIAHSGDVERRKQKHTSLAFAAGWSTADGGLRDKSYADAARLVDTVPTAVSDAYGVQPSAFRR